MIDKRIINTWYAYRDLSSLHAFMLRLSVVLLHQVFTVRQLYANRNSLCCVLYIANYAKISVDVQVFIRQNPLTRQGLF